MKIINDTVEFDIVDKIAEGGQGAVYKALQKGVEGFEKTVAIKTLLGEFSTDPTFVELFISEAKLVANLVHENIVQIYQLGRTTDGYYFVLEYVNGISLYEFLDFHSKVRLLIPEALSVYIASRIARGLAFAHSRKDSYGDPLNIVHCDVCPHNILITSEGLPKLTDFGVAKAKTMANEDHFSGKLPYMSPEQARQEMVDFRSDIYSLGIVLFHMLTGSHTRDITVGTQEILEQAKSGFVAWDKLSSINDDLMKILKTMLAMDPDDRYQTTDQLGRDLEYYIYKDGYGPTIVTLANYMKEQMPSIFEPSEVKVQLDNSKTVIMA